MMLTLVFVDSSVEITTCNFYMIYANKTQDAAQTAEAILWRGYDTVGNHHRAQVAQFELFEFVLILEEDKQLPVEQFEATVSQSAVSCPPSWLAAHGRTTSSVGRSCMYMSLYIHVSVCVYIYIYIHIIICLMLNKITDYTRRTAGRHPLQGDAGQTKQ